MQFKFLENTLRVSRLLGFIFTMVLCHQNSLGIERDPHYPQHWWKEVPRDQAPDWEILPQDAKEGEVILSKRNELGILSNFANTPFELNSIKFESVEGFWQSLKYPESNDDERNRDKNIVWTYTRAQVQMMSGFEAKKAGSLANENMKKLGIDWVTYQGQKIIYRENRMGPFYSLILKAMTLKLEQNHEVAKILKMTGDLKLMPDHKQSNDPPAWKYHEIWMLLRKGL